MKAETYEEILAVMTRDRAYIGDNLRIPRELQGKAKDLCQRYNMLLSGDGEEKAAILKELFGTCSPMVFIANGFHCDYGFNIHFKGLAVINYNVTMLDTSPIVIGENTFIGPGTVLSCAGHAMLAGQRGEAIATSAPIHLEDGVWLGANVTVCPGVTIGCGSVIGAGSVVNKDIPVGVLAAGVPCRVIRPITEADRITPEMLDF